MRPYRVAWFASSNNFGDVLTPYILDYFDIPYKYVEKWGKAKIISVGSIARFAKAGTTVLGSGAMRQADKLNPNAIWKLVRGPLTRKNVLRDGGSCPKRYGDPALLLPLLCSESEKEYEIGIVPHFWHYDIIKSRYPDHKIINVINENPLKVAKEITKCKKIISSSLHGIICAHAYHIPVAWFELEKQISGDGMKFADYYASVGIEGKRSTIDNPVFNVGKINRNPIIESFQEIEK